MGKQRKQWWLCFLGLQNHCRWWLQLWNEKTLVPWKKSYDQPRKHIKKQRHYFAQKVPSSQSYVFSSSHVWMWGLDYKESWMPKNWCFWTVVLEKTLKSPLDSKDIQPVHLKGNQSWLFTGRTDAEAETPILWPPDVKNWLIEKDPDTGRDWKWEEKGKTEDEMIGWHHQLNGHEFEQALGVGDGQGGLACCSPWGCKKSDTTEQLNWTVALWYCVSFCCTMKWISCMYTHGPSLRDLPPSPASPPLWVITEHGTELPVLHSRFPLARVFCTW